MRLLPMVAALALAGVASVPASARVVEKRTYVRETTTVTKWQRPVHRHVHYRTVVRYRPVVVNRPVVVRQTYAAPARYYMVERQVPVLPWIKPENAPYYYEPYRDGYHRPAAYYRSYYRGY